MSLCPHGYTAFYDCPTCEEPMGTAPRRSEDRHEFGCTAYVGRPCICATLRKQRAFGSHFVGDFRVTVPLAETRPRRARKPKHPERYVPASQAAAGLRQLADRIECREAVSLVAWDLNLSYWYFDEGAPRVTTPTEAGA